MKKDPAKNEEEALKDIYRASAQATADGGERARPHQAALFSIRSAMTSAAWALQNQPEAWLKGQRKSRILTKDNLVSATKYLLRLKKGEGSLDDIDHSAAGACARWANCSPTSAASGWPAPNASSRNA